MFTVWSFTKETHADFWSRVTANGVSRFQNFSTRSGFNWCISMCSSTQKWTAFNLNASYLGHLLCYNYKEKLEQSNSRSKPRKAGRHFILMTVTAMCFSDVLLCSKPIQNVPKAKISLQRIQASGGRCFASHLQSLTCLVVIGRRPESQMALLTQLPLQLIGLQYLWALLSATGSLQQAGWASFCDDSRCPGMEMVAPRLPSIRPWAGVALGPGQVWHQAQGWGIITSESLSWSKHIKRPATFTGTGI